MEKQPEVDGRTLPEVLGAYAQSDCARFHMPGHKGRGLNRLLHSDIAKWDVTELSFSDDLHRPENMLAEAQRRLARAYGAEASFFSVNGSTAAVQAMLLALAPGERLLLARDCHKSAVAGAALAGLDPAFVLPDYCEAYGLYGMVTPEALGRALDASGATAVLITSPNYCGFCADVHGLADAVHARGALLLVDAAHGAHFPFSPALPEGMGGYADLWCHSQHKTLNALNQCASLHVGKCRVPVERVQRALSMLQTTSPSYVLMASLDYATFSAPRQDWTGLVARCRALEARIAALPGLSVLPEKGIGAGVPARDPTRLVVDVSGRGVTGYEAQRALEGMGVYIEMADQRRLVLITSPEDDPRWYARLLDALRRLPYANAKTAAQPRHERLPVKRCTIRTALLCAGESAPLADAVGRVLAEAVGVYPPGIAACMPGEVLDEETCAFLREAEASGAALFGVRDGCVRVMEEAWNSGD